MKSLYTIIFLLIAICGNAQLLSVSPDFPKETDAGIVITLDATKGNQGLLNHSPSDVYIHIGCITSLSTSSSDWKYVPFTWATTNAAAQAVSLGNNKWQYTITGASLRAFFGITNTAEKILKIACLFRSGDGNTVQRNADGSDMYLPIYDANLYTRIVKPLRQPTYVPTPETITKNIGDAISLEAKASQTTTMTLYFNGTQLNTLSGTDITGSSTITTAGNQQIIAKSVSGSTTVSDTINFYVASSTTVAALPAGVVDGINYDSTGTAATLVLYAPGKNSVAVLGDFNNWTQSAAYQMNKTPDGNRFWLKITGLTAGTEYAYQYLIDNALQLADYNTEKVLDKNVDPQIPSATYPNLKAFPAQAAGTLASIIQTGKTPYNWQVTNFQRPDKRNLVIYELLVRDFLATSNWQTLKDTLSYLKKLGINAIEVMPFNNFEGYSSWGYNPNFYFAPDKVYGTETALKQFIDACHQQGFAVIMDMVLNHSYGSSPMVQMYWDATKNVPAANNPWFYQYPNHSYNVGYQFNHYTQATIDFTQRVVNYWLTNYKVDGYRFDLAKGFTKINTCDSLGNNCNVAKWGNYDQGRVNTWDTIYNQMQRASANSYCILEMFADNSEQLVEGNYGMMLWNNLNYNFNQATMGYATSGSDLSGGIYTSLGGWTQNGLVTYQESHDEERLMYKNEQYGNSSGSYNVKDTATGLKRNAMAAAFWAMMPGPKLMWQFGELGYDYTIGLCSNGTINGCNTDPKPLHWDYLSNTNRKALHDVYAKLLALRQLPSYLHAWTSSNVTYSFGNKAFNSLQVSSDSLNIVVVGNFDVASTTGNVTFQSAGTWYDYLNGTTFAATGASQSIILAPGEYHVYLSRNPNANAATASSYQLSSFTATRGASSIATAWATTNEVNMNRFELQRSTDSVNFTTINAQTASNKASQSYAYPDTASIALKATTNIFYRLKIVGNDSATSYSAVVKVAPAAIIPPPLATLTGVRNTTNIALSWVSTSTNVTQFELQRSLDATTFSTINTQAGTNTTTQQSYSYSDTDPIAVNAATVIYYRLKITATDGTFSYSAITSVGPAITSTPGAFQLVSFVGVHGSTSIAVAWQTTNETGLQQFELQRSTDTVNFTTIATRTPFNGASQGYGNVDTDPVALNAAGNLYYRIKITASNGAVSYSKILMVSALVYNAAPSIKTYPNPVHNGNLYIETNIGGNMQVLVVDIVGKVLQSYSVNTGSYTGGIIPVSVANLSNGMYIIKLWANGQTFTQRFVVQR